MNIVVDAEDSSPSRAWSPHTAALHRRRKFDTDTERNKLRDSLVGISLDDEEDMELFPTKPKSDSSLKKSRSKSPGTRRASRSKSPSALKKNVKGRTAVLSPRGQKSKLKIDEKPVAKELTQDDIPLEILKKLSIITDPDPDVKKSRERGQLEVDMMRNPTEKRILVEFRHKFDRKKFLSEKSELERQAGMKLAKEISIEEQKEAEFKAGCRRKREAEIEAEIAAREREQRTLDEARKHTVETIARGMEGVRKDAERTVECVIAARERKKRQDEEVERQIDEFRRNEGKDMHEAQRALKEAVIEQRIVSNN
jgi:hypothetical protein